MQDNSKHAETVRRAALPQVMFVPDVSVALQMSPDAARRAILRGECGPYFRVGGRRLAVIRESFLDSLAQRNRIDGAATGPRSLSPDDGEGGAR